MKRLTLNSTTRLLLSAGALLLMYVTTPATAGFAQSSDTSALISRINQLENQLQTLNRAVYRGEKPPSLVVTGNDASSAAVANFEVRLSQIEQQQRDMTGQVERLAHEIQQIKDRLDKMSIDNEQRFQQLGSGGAIPSSTPPSTSPSAPSAMAEVKGDLYATSGNSSSGTLGTMTESGARGGDPAGVLYESAFADIRAAKYDEAEKKFKQFMSLYPAHTLAGNAQYWLAETYYVRGDYNQSAKMFAQCYQDYPQGQKAADSLLKLGLSLGKIGRKEDACLALQQLKKQFPGDQSTVGARASQEIKTLGCK